MSRPMPKSEKTVMDLGSTYQVERINLEELKSGFSAEWEPCSVEYDEFEETIKFKKELEMFLSFSKDIETANSRHHYKYRIVKCHRFEVE